MRTFSNLLRFSRYVQICFTSRCFHSRVLACGDKAARNMPLHFYFQLPYTVIAYVGQERMLQHAFQHLLNLSDKLHRYTKATSKLCPFFSSTFSLTAQLLWRVLPWTYICRSMGPTPGSFCLPAASSTARPPQPTSPVRFRRLRYE